MSESERMQFDQRAFFVRLPAQTIMNLMTGRTLGRSSIYSDKIYSSLGVYVLLIYASQHLTTHKHVVWKVDAQIFEHTISCLDHLWTSEYCGGKRAVAVTYVSI